MPQPSSKSALIWFGSFFLFFGLALLVTGAQKYFEGRQMKEWGQSARGEVIEKHLDRASRAGNPRTRYSIRYRFRTGAGLPVENTVAVDAERFESLREGDAVDVSYIPQRPLRNHLGAEYFEVQSGIGEGISGTVLTVIGAVLVWGPARKWIREPRAPRRVNLPGRLFRTTANVAIALAAIFVAAVIAEAIPVFQAIDARIGENHSLYLGLAMTVMITGLGLFIGSLLVMMIQGKSSEEFKLTELFAAVRGGSAGSPVWRRRLLVTTGAMIMVFGLLSVFFVAGPGFMRVLVIASPVYVLYMLIRGPKKRKEAKAS